MTVRIDDDLENQINLIAERAGTTPARIVRAAIAKYASRFEAGESFQREADASWEAYRQDGLHLTGDEVSAWLKTVGTDEESEIPECHT